MKLSNTEFMTTLVGENAPRSAVTASLNNEDKKEHTPQQVDPLEELTTHERYLASPFTKQNVALVFGNSKLYVQKELLIAVSPVFKAMFSSSFLEGSKEEIPLPGKKLSHFVLFLRYLAPGFDDEISGRYTNSSIIWSSGQQYCNVGVDIRSHLVYICDFYLLF